MSRMSAIAERDRDATDTMIFERMVEHFIKTWAPEDPRERAEFAAGLQIIVRQVYTDAQRPILDRFTKLAMSMPSFPILTKP